MSIPEPLLKLFNKIFGITRKIDDNKTKYIENLKNAVAIQSVSAWPHTRNQVREMVKWTAERCRTLGIHTELKELGDQSLPDGSKIPLPPVLFGTLGNDSKKRTVLVYGHLDVQPALIEDGWDTEPFVLVEKNNKLYGRGSSDDKGPVLGWLHAIEAYQAIGVDVPVNLKLVFEGMEETGSIGLEKLLKDEKDKFLAGVDYVCISDNYWLGTEKPCITYGLRGVCYFHIEVECASKDLHSGVFGGTVAEAMTDLVFLLNTLIDKEGNILIPGINNEVAPLTEKERELYNKISFNVDEFRSNVGCRTLLHKEKKAELLMHRWRYPCLSIHGIEGAFSEPGQKTVIPKKVYMAHGGSPWMEDPFHPHYTAGVKATKHVYNVEPDLIREGGSIPVTLVFQEVTGKNVILLPMGAGDDGAHSQNEKIDVRNYIEGTKLLGAYLYEVSQL
ncbi:hypothetical protein NQ314_001879 [Rhamnusium bicolor]|uniref:Cytosolic non-specific dipeptidase n=1 Tax=Rhamnusium bicolor TaxID=1586634 RepID=A0AAV8ZQU7_9CUCU|nr:hypothetical protein NQ314_001879 [Rhamnusium bicolor]